MASISREWQDKYKSEEFLEQLESIHPGLYREWKGHVKDWVDAQMDCYKLLLDVAIALEDAEAAV